MKAFLATLPSEENNQAGKLIRGALTELGQMVSGAEERKNKDRKRGNPFDERTGKTFDRGEEIRRLLSAEFEGKRWFEQDPEMARWMDELFEIQWFTDLRRAADLPLGVVQDPRGGQVSLGPQPEIQELGWVVQLRALQLEAKGDLRGTLSLFKTALGVARQLENNAPAWCYWGGFQLESVVLSHGLDRWLRKSRLRQGASPCSANDVAKACGGEPRPCRCDQG